MAAFTDVARQKPGLFWAISKQVSHSGRGGGYAAGWYPPSAMFGLAGLFLSHVCACTGSVYVRFAPIASA